MKKTLSVVSMFIIISLLSSVSGCKKEEIKNPDLIVRTAYEAIPERERRTIKNWENAKVENFKSEKDYIVRNLETDNSENSNGINAVRVTFQVPNSELGDISVYINKKSKKVLWIDERK
jgi:hypothetical protein